MLLFLSVLCMCGLTGCGGQEKEETKQVKNEIQIGFSFDSLVIERWQRDRDVFVSQAQEDGAKVNVQNAGGDVETQKKQIMYFIEQKMDVIVVVAALTAGSAFLMWVGEQINDKGVGNGISMVLLINILSRIPQDMVTLYETFVKGKTIARGLLMWIIIAVVIIAVVVLVLILNGAERRIPVQYSKKMAGRKMVGGQSSNIPLKVNTAGVIPIIFASSIMSFPSIILSFVGKSDIKGIGGTLIKMLNSNNWFDKTNPVASLGLILYIVLVIFFAYFYTSITFNPMEVADNMKKQGGFIPGIRPGKSTVDYLNNLLSYIIFIGAAGLTIVAVIPFFFNGFFKANVSFGGTSLIIIASVILETLKQIESMMLVRNYKGFLND